MLFESVSSESLNHTPPDDAGCDNEESSFCTAADVPHTQDTDQGCRNTNTSVVADTITRLLKGKGKAWTATVEKKGTLKLLDLPVDILKEIIKEVTHTNDLTSLALTHSALHNLAIPYIYSRFDIVWPDAQNTSEPRTGVDALTFGLATLVMSHEVFGESSPQCHHEDQSYICCHCGGRNEMITRPRKTDKSWRKNRRGNYFAQYTRKFSLGNGPPDWVQEYLINKEGGKMLGTLVALAVARMPNLETFIWDMPTGVLRDVWSALSSLADRRDGGNPRLQKLWIRYHDNRTVGSAATVPPPGNVSQSPPSAPVDSVTFEHGNLGNAVSPDIQTCLTPLEKSYRNIEYPNFSILPPLRSLTVLDIDEPAYLEELSVLVERSAERLRELRVGAASMWYAKSWSSSPTQGLSSQTAAADSSMDYAASGGMLGMIMSKLYDCRKQNHVLASIVRDAQPPIKPVDASLIGLNTTELDSQTAPSNTGLPVVKLPGIVNEVETDVGNVLSVKSSNPDEHVDIPGLGLEETRHHDISPNVTSPPIPSALSFAESHSSIHEKTASSTLPSMSAASQVDPLKPQSQPHTKEVDSGHQPFPISQVYSPIRSIPQQRRLRLETLELERVPMSVHVLQKTIDWTILTSLTLLNCESDDELWKALRRTYTPRTSPASILLAPQSLSKRTSVQYSRTPLPELSSSNPSDYRLKLRRIHTNAVSSALISFLKEALAPNSLEWMFLQDGGQPTSKVTIDAIYRGPLRRHRGSLKKVMVDSGDRRGPEGSSRNQKWKKWIFNREVLTFVTSGKMSCLRELAMSVDHKDWHFFLQRLPNIPHVRSLYVPHIADHVFGHHLDARELALQVVDIVALRPEIELCYMGISTKCFEILENRHLDDSVFSNHDSSTSPANAGPGGVVMGDADEDSDADDDDNGDNEGDDENAAATGPMGDTEETESDVAEDSDVNSDDDSLESEDGRKRPRLKLREILFYDDKVSIFKARHGQL